MSYEAILFDLDGVVVDTQLAVTTFWQQIAARYRCELTTEDLDRSVYGRRASETLEMLFAHLSGQQKDAILQELQAAEQQAVYQEVSGVGALLRALHAAQIPTALVTSGQRWKVETVLAQLGLAGLFAVQVSAEDMRRGKPDPEGYLRAAHLLKRPASSCIVFEDAPGGVQAARVAGALCIGVRPEALASPLLAAGARYVIPDFTMVTVQCSLPRLSRELGR
ncbi:hydrolase [Ktedonobacter sp. SOSP1-52]|uniref:HAD family hydrolase n=1 Tax=Ktedonobacter sp. SOSP1-52 TaxID=2778366 RepID=UPI00191566F5|nr:HAD family phosphatase [Ktedonobacter sp. SOSP1-52]GHO70004.1 hydrolase [Ktedonobacter sp. SOSP1-52]